MLAQGTVNADGTATIAIANPLARKRDIVGRDFEFTAVYFEDPLRSAAG
jgi:hypothetical protein